MGQWTINYLGIYAALFFIIDLIPFNEPKTELVWEKNEISIKAGSVTGFSRLNTQNESYLFFGCYENGNVEVYKYDRTKLIWKESFSMPSNGIRDIDVLDIGDDNYLVAVANELKSEVVILIGQKELKYLRSFQADGASDVDFADLNNDGLQDIIVASSKGIGFWLENEGGQSFKKQTFNFPFNLVQQTVMLDYNFDGAMDLVYASEDSNELAVALNFGNNVFKYKKLASNIKDVLDIQIQDIDQDGDLDLAVASFSQRGLILLLNEKEDFRKIQLGKLKNITSILALDLDRNGNISFVVSSFDKTHLSLYRYQGNEIYKEYRLNVEVVEPTRLLLKEGEGKHYSILASSFSAKKMYEINLEISP